ncbi:WD40 repeat-like protein [Gonapodya prolifera JEL478]|uniref:WD40 repeat-like protein n=1 Tax=Gonapodya prolifera (strain JEL478) TaxID=1344416 RepID=A0A139A5E3_GONPJ|nr:WD40 repeat-like protein [Gonapodya prolifera JEL478]|eukprot:KXS11868.1 WD40 repeat-like protein [Gonapodya prolifera JEL478]
MRASSPTSPSPQRAQTLSPTTLGGPSADAEEVYLERVIGSTVSGNHQLAAHPRAPVFAYTAGRAIVLYNYRKQRQSVLVEPQNPNDIECCAFNQDGTLVAVGEKGETPRILVWDLSSRMLAAAPLEGGHKDGVLCLAFSSDGDTLASVGVQSDATIAVWRWRTGERIASARAPIPTSSLFFLPKSLACVTASHHAIKHWQIQPSAVAPNRFILDSRPANMGAFREKSFVDASGGFGEEGSEAVYGVTQNGTLVMFGEDGAVEKWVELKVKSAYSVCATSRFVVCGCSDGIVRAFEPGTLQYIATLPKLAFDGTEHAGSATDVVTYPNAIAVRSASGHDTGVICVAYSDGSMSVWDFSSDEKKVEKVAAFAWRRDLGAIENTSSTAFTPPLLPTLPSPAPTISFVTHHQTSPQQIRFWQLLRNSGSPISTGPVTPTTPTTPSSGLRRPAKELSKVIGITEQWTQMRFSSDGLWAVGIDASKSAQLIMPGNASSKPVMLCPSHADTKCIALQSLPRGRVLVAVGTREGTLEVFRAQSDRCIHIQSVAEHQGAITTVNFAEGGRKLVTASQNGTLTIRTREKEDEEFLPVHTIRIETTIHGISLDPSNRHVVVLSDSRTVTIYSMASGKCLRVYTEDEAGGGDGETPTVWYERADVHPSGLIMGVTGTDGIVRLLEFWSGDCIGTLKAPSAPLAGFFFTTCEKRALLASNDGTVAVFRLPRSFVREARRKLNNAGVASTVKGLEPPRQLQFSDDDLPSWARAVLGGDRNDNASDREQTFRPPVVKGKWAERLGENDRVVLYSEDDGGRVARLDDWARRRFTLPPGTPGGRGGAGEESDSDEEEKRSDGSSTVRFEIGDNDTISTPFMLHSQGEQRIGVLGAGSGNNNPVDDRWTSPKDSERSQSNTTLGKATASTVIGHAGALSNLKSPASRQPNEPPMNTTRKLSDPLSETTVPNDLQQPVRSKSAVGSHEDFATRKESVSRTSSSEVDRIRQRLQSLGISWRPSGEAGHSDNMQSLSEKRVLATDSNNSLRKLSEGRLNRSTQVPIVNRQTTSDDVNAGTIRTEFQKTLATLERLKQLQQRLTLEASPDHSDAIEELQNGFASVTDLVNGTQKSARRATPLTLDNPRVREFVNTMLKLASEL